MKFDSSYLVFVKSNLSPFFSEKIFKFKIKLTYNEEKYTDLLIIPLLIFPVNLEIIEDSHNCDTITLLKDIHIRSNSVNRPHFMRFSKFLYFLYVQWSEKTLTYLTNTMVEYLFGVTII